MLAVVLITASPIMAGRDAVIAVTVYPRPASQAPQASQEMMLCPRYTVPVDAPAVPATMSRSVSGIPFLVNTVERRARVSGSKASKESTL